MATGQVIAIDGKNVQRLHDRAYGEKSIYLVRAWAGKNERVTGHRKVEDKGNERTGSKLLEILGISGCIVTNHCDRDAKRDCQGNMKAKGSQSPCLKAKSSGII
jgi:hypothetical protein